VTQPVITGAVLWLPGQDAEDRLRTGGDLIDIRGALILMTLTLGFALAIIAIMASNNPAVPLSQEPGRLRGQKRSWGRMRYVSVLSLQARGSGLGPKRLKRQLRPTLRFCLRDSSRAA
jgi:hypothetical protein